MGSFTGSAGGGPPLGPRALGGCGDGPFDRLPSPPLVLRGHHRRFFWRGGVPAAVRGHRTGRFLALGLLDRLPTLRSSDRAAGGENPADRRDRLAPDQPAL